MTCVYLQYPKAKYHLLLMCRENVHHIGDIYHVKTLNDLEPSHLHELKELHTLGRNIASNLSSCDASITLKLGYHAVPSFEPLHLHIISSDLDSVCITKKKHIMSFTSPFFVDPESVELHLESGFADSVMLSVRKDRAASILKDAPMTCKRCNRVATTVPDWKRHNSECSVVPEPIKETDRKVSLLLGWKSLLPPDVSSKNSRGTKRELSTDGYDSMGTDDQPNNILGTRTKFGRRQLRNEDKRSNNARVRNTYLKISMDDAVFNQLHTAICDVSRQWQDENSQSSISKKQANKQMSINPRTCQSLHMTYFFASQVLDEMSSSELQLWHEMVGRCILEHNKGSSRDYSLRMNKLRTFPPNRDYLIVAEFDPSNDLVELYDELCKLAVKEKENSCKEEIDDIEYEFPLLQALTSRQQKSNWIAHITLGNISGGSKDDMATFKQWLGNKSIQVDAISSKISIQGLTIGGPVPRQAELDWNFPFHS